MSAERCPQCGKFRSSWTRNRHQSDWDVMNNGPEYICTQCAEARPSVAAVETPKENTK